MRLLLRTTQDTISPALYSGGVDAAEGKGLCPGNRPGPVLVGGVRRVGKGVSAAEKQADGQHAVKKTF